MPRVKPEDTLRDLLPSLEERDGTRALWRRVERALVDNQNKIDELLTRQAELTATLAQLAGREVSAPAVNVAPPEVIVSPVLQSPAGATWKVSGKDGNGRAFSFTVTKEG